MITMGRESVTEGNLAVLNSPALELPKATRAHDFGRALEATFKGFFKHLNDLDGPLAELITARQDRIETLAASIMDAWYFGSDGEIESALSCLDTGLGSVQKEIISMSRRHSRILPGQCWYRLAAWEGVSAREHLFHTPFELPQLSYRFSTPATPSLYLANSVYLCWLECGRPRFERCFVARFEIDTTGFELLDIPASSDTYISPLDFPDIPGLDIDARQLMNSPYVEEVTSELAEYLTVWPLLAAATVRKRASAWEQPPEYVIPQLLMLWVRESDSYIGIRYFTSKIDRSTNSNDWPIDLALPARTRKASGYCDFLRTRARWTEPQPLAKMRKLRAGDLATPAAAELRERRSGKVMLRRARSLQPYFETTFGKMEYWLDRAELELASI
jgi:hypothetical protein